MKAQYCAPRDQKHEGSHVAVYDGNVFASGKLDAQLICGAKPQGLLVAAELDGHAKRAP